jgi:two-component system phosphate regulon sensor histidine kinase PhoR
VAQTVGIRPLFRQIFRSIFLVALVTLLVGIVLMGALVYLSQGVAEQQELARELRLIRQTLPVLDNPAHYINRLGSDDLRVTWIAADGSVMYDSEVANTAQMDNHLARSEIAQALATGEGQSSRYSDTLGEVTYYHALRLADGSVLRISRSYSSVFSLLSTLLAPVLVAAIAIAAMAGLVARTTARSLVLPINRLDLDHPLQNDVYPELDPLLRRMEAQRERIETQTDEVARSRRAFTANVSHELKTPLTVISGYAELLKTGLARPEDSQHFSELIYGEAQQMKQLVEDILVVSQLEERTEMTSATDAPVTPDAQTDVDICLLTERVVERLEPFAQQNQVTIALNFCQPQVLVRGSPNILNAIVYNLCENAIRYNKIGGSVSVSIGYVDGDNRPPPLPLVPATDATSGSATSAGAVENDTVGCSVWLRVTDTGIGIRPSKQDKVFERFYRVDHTRSRETGGTGLGLAIVKHGVQYLGASIELQSTPQQGTSITVIFAKPV